MIKRIIFLVEHRFSIRDYQRLGIELLEKNGFCMEVWDLTAVLHPRLFKSYTPPDIFDYKGLRLFKNEHEMVTRLSGLSRADFVINMTAYHCRRLKVYRALSRSQAGYAVSFANLFPQPQVKKKLPDRLIDYARGLAGLRYKAAWQRLFMKLPHNWLGVRPPDLIFTSGEDIRFNCPSGGITEIMNIHAYDYDRYLAERDSPREERRIAVFLDEFLPFHPDFILCGGQSPVAAGQYYSSLNSFFDLVESQAGLKVVIAAHPRSNYENAPDFFNGRACVRGMTASLVKECKLVLMHVSTAINFAVLFYKPITFLTCLDIDRSWEGLQIREFARWFGKTPIFMDGRNVIDWEKELLVDHNRYKDYKRAYIKSDKSEDLPFWQIVAGRLKRGAPA